MDFNGSLDAHFEQALALHQRRIDHRDAVERWESELLGVLEEAMQALEKGDADTAKCCIDHAIKMIEE